MQLPFEAAKGAAEKVMMVRFPVLMRVVLPGLLATAVLYPETIWLLEKLPRDPNSSWQQIAAYAVLVLLLGFLVSTLNNTVYSIYEGRSFWPQGLLKWATAKQQARVDKMRTRADEAKAGNRYDEMWNRLLIYPTNNNGDPEATQPTLLGNLLAGYEQYPRNRYGMDSIFYWPRIWLQIEKGKREEIDSQWSVADGFLALSAVSVVGGLLWLLQALAASADLFSYRVPLSSAAGSALAGTVWLLLGYGWYRLSLPFHRENGEVFKSIFDVHRDKILEMTSLRPMEKELWRGAWAYLQYLQLKCPNCGEYNGASSEQCPNCKFDLAELRKTLRDTGKFSL